MKWRFWQRDREPEPEPTSADSANPEFSFDELLTSSPDTSPVVPDYLAQDAESPAEEVESEDSFDMSDLFAAPDGPGDGNEQQPDWIATEDEDADKLGDLNMGSLYTRANPHELRRRREAKEREQSLLNRAMRGDVGAEDIPLRGALSNLFFGLMAKAMAPFETILDSKGVIILAIGTAALFVFMAFSMIEFANWQFGDL